MSLRIPLTSDQTLQVEFHEIERRLRRLEKGLNLGPGMAGPINIVSNLGGASVNLSGIYARLDAIEAALEGIDFDSLPNLGPVGPTAQKGFAPSPGLAEPPTGVAQHVLTEAATWGFPLRGLVQVATSGSQTDPPRDVVNVAASVTAHDVTAANIECVDLVVHGTVTPRSFVHDFLLMGY